ncbi:MAG: HAD-IC family P-type ATPase [Rhodocyclaceae bacterium]|nr:HAD-IC family P-type ATPase [Rhodocyclaceae bacterium]
MTPSSADSEPFHAVSGPQAVIRLASDRGAGLAASEVEARLARWGANVIPPPSRRGPLRRLAAQFHNVLIYLLLVAAGVTAVLGHGVDSAVIIAVVLINALIGFVQEGRAEDALAGIRKMLSNRARVVRDGRRIEIAAEGLVPGDIVHLVGGDRVPADIRLLELRGLRVDESALTGESVAVDKSLAAVAPAALPADRSCMAHAGTMVTQGMAVGIVAATGLDSEIGRISAMVRSDLPLTTPLMRQLARFGRQVTWAVLLLAVAAYGFGVWWQGYSAADMFLAAVGLAVAAIPEGLPAIMTIALAIGVRRMAHRKAIVRRLPAVEALGSVTVICSDKTGTLTRNEMSVERAFVAGSRFDVAGEGYSPEGTVTLADGDMPQPSDDGMLELARAGLLCNDATLEFQDGRWTVGGDPTEGALLSLAGRLGLDLRFELEAWPRVDAIPFESRHRYMASLHHDHAGHHLVLLKGAPERVLECCDGERRAGERVALDRHRWMSAMASAADDGMRLLAVAMKIGRADAPELAFADVEAGGFTLLGMLAISDPPRSEAAGAVARCRRAGIGVRMITGDHAATAVAIARRLGLADEVRSMTGSEIEAASDDALRRAVRDTQVFARASPEHKLRLVQALQANGEVVAMTGDGVNDAPALKQADIGVAMGCKGTETARDAAEMVLADDNFASIAAAVEEGRTVYDNLRKAIVFILPTNGGEALMILAAIVAGLSLPITPAQILWVNMITAVTLALALAFEPTEADIMKRPPRPSDEALLDRFLAWRIVLVSLLLVGTSLGQFLFDLASGASLEVARTGAVNALVIGEAAYLFSVRRLRTGALGEGGLRGLQACLIAVGVVALAQLAFTYAPPMQALFGSRPLDLQVWMRMLAAGVVVFAVVELEKLLIRRRLA